MAYFRGIFLANTGVGGGQNSFQGTTFMIDGFDLDGKWLQQALAGSRLIPQLLGLAFLPFTR